MESQNESQHSNAERYLKTMLERYPEGTHAEQGQAWLDQIEMARAESRAEFNVRRGREPTSEAERLYARAREYERIGDRLTALEKYEALPTLISDDEKNRPFLNLARRQAEHIRQTVDDDADRVTFVKEQLAQAAALYEEGKKLPAREKWQAIVRLYGDNPEFDLLTDQARASLAEVRSD